MRAIGLHRYGGPEVLEIVDLPEPHAGPGEIRVRVQAATVNPTDISMREGAQEELLRDRTPPYVPGMELAGEVDQVGAGSGFQIGDRVLAMTSPVIAGGGAQAELVVVPAGSAVRMPDTLTFLEAATLPMNGLTVRLALDLMDLAAGDHLGITGAAGIIGRYAIQLGVAEGLTVIAQCAAKDADAVLGLGAHAWVDRNSDWTSAMRASTGGRGVDGLIDAAVIGSPVLAAVRDGGQVAAVRAFEGETERDIEVKRVGVRAYLKHPAELQQLVDLVVAGRLALPGIREFAPHEVASAHGLMTAGGVRGRLVIDMTRMPAVTGASDG